jgi:oxalate decarboxylase/phosphoglucose isomerase-like protein (cupin superfamily)
VKAGTTVLFPRGAVHMLHNTGDEEMKVVCFFAPATKLENYEINEEVDCPDEPVRFPASRSDNK